ncbi:hypothetical protein PR202_gb29550 [Eleusine coracana subsp. coracana]|uniref:Sulfotransferase n=1 Tax=Eleusine coracana subsp. coracana TaxID=191504 RepID=A0AAV5G0R4_ELECO|nr:hypothetical protein PR202_gb29550 [Eleusine coracana subsp. coracana]
MATDTHNAPVLGGPILFEDVKAGLAALVPPELYVPVVVALEQRFDPRPDNIIVASFPNCGTTWVLALLVAMMMWCACPPGTAHHPLRRLNPHQCLPFLKAQFADGEEVVLEALPSPCLAYTHMSVAFLPRARTCRVMYVCRDPKDVVACKDHDH